MKTEFIATIIFVRFNFCLRFSENGGPINDNLLEEEIIEQLAKQNLARNWAAYSNKGGKL